MRAARAKLVKAALASDFQPDHVGKRLEQLHRTGVLCRGRRAYSIYVRAQEPAAKPKQQCGAAKPRRKPSLRLTNRSSPPTAGGDGKCDSCGKPCSDRNHITHTIWGDVDLCRECCLQAQARPRIKPHDPQVYKIVSAPIGSGRRR